MLHQSTASPKSPPGDSVQSSTSPSTASMGPPVQSSPEVDQGNGASNNVDERTTLGANQHLGVTAAAAGQGPKVVQTAFIHKLYNMLEDKSIQHLISWSNTNESFVMSPSNEFSKVLAQYFKHTNISSFVRQLNMYGFHKVSDVFHTGSPDSALWEFKHGNGNFKKGDLMGLREIKRRASKHTLIHRDSFSNPKPGTSQPGTPAEVQPDPEVRLATLEHAFYDMHARLQRTEDSHALVNSKCQALAEGLVRCHQWAQNLSQAMQTVVQPDSPLYADIASMQKEIARHLELVRSLEYPHDPLIGGRHTHLGSLNLDGPLSPRPFSFDESRRSSMQLVEPPRLSSIRPPVPPIPPQYLTSPRRYGLGSASQPSPAFNRPSIPAPPPPHIHPLSSGVSPPNLARRHTSADIREHGWPVQGHNPNGSPYASGNSSVQWPPSSPNTTPQAGDQQIRDQLASYEINGSRRQSIPARPSSPSLPSDTLPSGLGVDTVPWSLGPPKLSRINPFEMHSAPATRRSSMASNVHSLLNPTAERDDEDEGLGEERKRKRLQ